MRKCLSDESERKITDSGSTAVDTGKSAFIIIDIFRQH